ncbi:MAG: lipoprotein signal peptidase [Gemmatimonadaceae bacterium]|nr:lipoprotein signal peptidase [Gemmatimonadaceae bacterium]
MTALLGSVQPSATTMKRWWVIPLVVIVLDQVTKWVIQATLPYGASIPGTGFFNVVHFWNTGAAFSFLADQSGWQRYFFIALAIVVSAVLGWMLRKPLPLSEALGFSLIIGGALANAIDRLVRGYVVDFLDFYWRDWHWPAFNAADIAITLGAALLIAGSFVPARSSNTPRK